MHKQTNILNENNRLASHLGNREKSGQHIFDEKVREKSAKFMKTVKVREKLNCFSQMS